MSYSINCKQIKDKSGDLTAKSWDKQHNYKWTQADLIKITPALTDDIGNENWKYVKEAMISLCDSNEVAQAPDGKLYFAFNRACGKNPSAKYCNKVTNIGSRLKWFDHELKEKRHQAIEAGQHVTTQAEKQIHITACRNYRKLRQRKQRDFHRDCIHELETATVNGNHNMWQVLKEICDYHSPSRDGPTSEEFFFYHFSRLAVPNAVDYFDEGYENMAIDFINKFQSPVKLWYVANGKVVPLMLTLQEMR